MRIHASLLKVTLMQISWKQRVQWLMQACMPRIINLRSNKEMGQPWQSVQASEIQAFSLRCSASDDGSPDLILTPSSGESYPPSRQCQACIQTLLFQFHRDCHPLSTSNVLILMQARNLLGSVFL